LKFPVLAEETANKSRGLLFMPHPVGLIHSSRLVAWCCRIASMLLMICLWSQRALLSALLRQSSVSRFVVVSCSLAYSSSHHSRFCDAIKPCLHVQFIACNYCMQ